MDCPHCPGGFGLEHPLYEDDLFWIVCDVHPLVQGHILIIPKNHISVMGALPDSAFNKYKELYSNVKTFINSNYDEIAVFEHGITGQTVFHAHTHFLPFTGDTSKIIEDNKSLRKISSLEDVRTEFKQKQKYLFFENKNQMYLVDTNLGYPGFFRKIFGTLLDAENRANWKQAREKQSVMQDFEKDISALEFEWKK